MYDALLFVQFEQEILKVHNAHEALVKQVQRRENLDKAMRIKLESEIRRQREINKQLKGKECSPKD